MVEKCIRAGICGAIHQYEKAIGNYVKNYDKNKEKLDLNYWDVNKFYAWAISQKLFVDCLKWVEDTSQVNKDFIKKLQLR